MFCAPLPCPSAEIRIHTAVVNAHCALCVVLWHMAAGDWHLVVTAHELVEKAKQDFWKGWEEDAIMFHSHTT